MEPIDERPIQERIIERAQQLFFTHGFSNVTTDDVAAGLGISKKTLYQHFASKEDLVRDCMYAMRTDLAARLEAIIDDRELEFTAKLRGVMAVIADKMSRLQRPHIEDMHRKAPHLMQDMERFRRERVLPMFERLFAQGARRGVLRRDIDPQLFLQMFYTLVEGMKQPSVILHLPYSLAEVFHAILSVMLEGMMTDEGRRQFEGKDSGRPPRSRPHGARRLG